MILYDEIFEKVIKIEGGYVNHSNDRGGETYNGIARTFWGDWEGWSVIDEAKKRYIRKQDINRYLESLPDFKILIKKFYKDNFWDPMKLDGIKNSYIAEELFDTAVNQHWKTSAKHFQNALNKLNDNQQLYSDIKVDGKIGPITLKTLTRYLEVRNFTKIEKIKVLLKVIEWYQAEVYIRFSDNNKEQESFIFGWFKNRINNVNII